MSYINILLWGHKCNKSNKITSDTLWDAYISNIQFSYNSEKQSTFQQLLLLSVCSDDSCSQLKSFVLSVLIQLSFQSSRFM